ncbi:MAG: 50S ribosomal protein L34 [Candidatus Zambryskibacteria bacterium RIFCSPHIGHO2_01_FULL_43_25]|uniref:Large ribosomal subunit protein bL34 n=1 Tax=Candidatus Zambryskibacteria bacterium RIFCSPLOWO2_01_FULL_45_21 TaxID=1802761 RepID=A0A1G2U5X5_9BACT|nr:MAG: 50S ribosomal protein L34 [Candidatus Zambryskibacteria bacterium RIFCSPHIGHO2_01_FULL_43_25]OHB00755.1 MAG: 50S ribosomal protein L34 [Candidatus Zambryskibacteria bacterium RIFCSPHIGHO2_12_FULL_44_12b]OHB04360.1 MAG: 50S ribosomal protein L34 [Candidatus Zambryskibacteria bacterium RIFCSPLOWO2_01_FULL_45_21]
MSKTYKPKKKKRKSTHGFLSRSQTPGGRRVLQKRRRKGRRRVAL